MDTPVTPLRVVVGGGGHTRGASQGWLLVVVDTPVAPLRVVVGSAHTCGASQGWCCC